MKLSIPKNYFFQKTSLIFFLGLFLVGVGYVFLLPPFEGFDESAHFSRIREVSGSFRSGFNSESFMDKAVTDFSGPMPYSSGAPPYNVGNVYPSFFHNDVLINSFLNEYRNKPFDLNFVATSIPNWQIQHPPLYYFLISPVLSQLSNFSFTSQLVILRLTSFAISLFGFFLGYLAFKNIEIKKDVINNPCLGFIAYPIIFPMFFLEFARVGNDSLCILLIGLISYFLSFGLRRGLQPLDLVIYGILLGLGLLTKAFFVPIGAGLILFLILKKLANLEFRDHIFLTFKISTYVLIPTLVVGGSWYIFKFLSFGDMGVGGEASELINGSGLLAGLVKNFQVTGLIRGALVPLVSFSWAGTWSLVRMPILSQLPLLALALWLFVSYFRAIKDNPFEDYGWLVLWLFSLFYLALVVHVLVSMALTGLGTSGGWYLHILAPFLAPAVGISIQSILKSQFKKIIFFILLGYSFIFQLMAIWFHMALFSGCALKANDKSFLFLENNLCLDSLQIVIKNLQVLASPYFAVLALFLGFSLIFVALYRSLNIELHHEA